LNVDSTKFDLWYAILKQLDDLNGKVIIELSMELANTWEETSDKLKASVLLFFLSENMALTI